MLRQNAAKDQWHHITKSLVSICKKCDNIYLAKTVLKLELKNIIKHLRSPLRLNYVAPQRHVHSRHTKRLLTLLTLCAPNTKQCESRYTLMNLSSKKMMKSNSISVDFQFPMCLSSY